MPSEVLAVLRPDAPGAERWLDVLDLGVASYDDVLTLQRDAARARIAGQLAHDLAIVVQHPPVVTLGRSSKAAHLLASPDYLQSRGVQLREVERGGDVTVHEPGQLVVYPIIDLKQHRRDLHWYLRQLEEVIIRALGDVGLEAVRRDGLTGVWIEDRKIASIGVHARDWVTWHGVALNVTNDLATFAHVVPCGIANVEVTSVARELARMGAAPVAFCDVSKHVIERFGDVFALSPRLATRAVQASLGAVQTMPD